MKLKTKTTKWFDNQDFINFSVFLLKNHLTMTEFAKKMGVSPSYVCQVAHGNKVLSDKCIEKFKKAGFDIENYKI